LLAKHRATAIGMFSGSDGPAVAFEMHGRRVLFRLALPTGTDPQTERARWRALLLSIKAKLVSVESRIETFEDAFMAHVVMPDGTTVSEHVRPRIADAYKNQRMVPLLPGPGKH
jgi:hypothetical protein